MNELTQSLLKAISRYDMNLKGEYKRVRKLEQLSHPYVKRVTSNRMDRIVHLENHDILVRAFSRDGKIAPVLLFFHGGGFVTGDFDSYSNVCATLAAQTGYKVVSVNYRLAPEHKFPAGVEDCYAVTQQILTHCEEWYQVSADQVILIGDSAGATLSCVTSFLCRDRGGLMPGGQILIYPAAWCDYTDATPFASVAENGADYILTRKKLLDYMELYASEPEDRLDPRFAPLRNTDFSGLPPTLLLTMEFDPLRDEGEELGRRLIAADNPVSAFRILNGVHGAFRLPVRQPVTAAIYRHIKTFLNCGEESE